MLAGLDKGGRGFTGACIQSPIMGEQPSEPSTARARRRFAIEQSWKKSQSIDEFAHGGGARSARRRRQQQFEPGDAALGEPRAGDPDAGAAP